MTDDDLEDDLGWHALNYRTAHTVHADAMWKLLAACVDRKIAAERERLAVLCDANAQVKREWYAKTESDDDRGAAEMAEWLASCIRGA